MAKPIIHCHCREMMGFAALNPSYKLHLMGARVMPFQKANPTSRRALLPLIAAAALSPAVLVPRTARAQGAAWQIYRREDLGFEVEMPGKPNITVKTSERDDRWVRSIGAELDFDRLYFGVGHLELTEALSVEQASAAQRMAARQLGIKAPPRETAITMNGFPVLDVVSESEAFSMVVRSVIMNKRSISAIVTGNGQLSEDPSVRRFLDSFKLLPAAR
jgi:hypothetical protein